MHNLPLHAFNVQATAQVYRIVTPQSSGLYYNVRIQLNQSEGHAGFYCNPSWGGQPNSESDIAQPGNAVWQTGVQQQKFHILLVQRFPVVCIVDKCTINMMHLLVYDTALYLHIL